MKNIILSTFLLTGFTFTSGKIDCFDFAVDELLKAEIVRGSPMSDEEAFNYLNYSQAICMDRNKE